MDTQLLNAIRDIVREIVREEMNPRFEELETDLKLMHADIKVRLKVQDDKIDTMLEAWEIQKQHRRELDDHEKRITTVEHRIPAVS